MGDKRERITAYVSAEMMDDLEAFVFSLRRHGIRTTKSDVVGACIKDAISEYGRMGENAPIVVSLRGSL